MYIIASGSGMQRLAFDDDVDDHDDDGEAC